MNFEQKISLYQGVKDTNGSLVTVQEALETIKSDDLIHDIFNVAHELDDKKRNALKSKLPAVTWSGRFTKRNAQQLQQHSGIICLDFDKLPDVIEAKKSLILQIPDFVVSVFVSPSLKGIKVLCAVEITATDVPGIIEQHTALFGQLAGFFKKCLELEADESGKDVSRLCFLSWDVAAYIAEEVTPYKLLPKQQTETTAQAANEFTSVSDELDNVRTFTDRIKSYTAGKRNDYVNTFVYNAKTNGIEESETLWYVLNAFGDYVDGEKALRNIVSSVYKNKSIVFGSKRREKKRVNKQSTGSKTVVNKSSDAPSYNEIVKFWYTVEKVDKETGELKTEHKFDHDGLTFFLANNGYRKIRLGDKGYQFVRLSGGLIEAVEPDDISHFLMTYLHKDVKPNADGEYDLDSMTDDLHEVRKMYKRGVNTYTKTTSYASVPELKPSFLRDSETDCYLYFENGYVQVTANDKKFFTYDNLKANIWSKQRKQFQLKLLNDTEIEKSIVFRFINMAILGNGSDDGKDPKRLLSMLTTIGYCIDTYKDPTNTKAPVFQDRKPNLSGQEANGGSGKTLTAHMIGKMINSCLIDGKGFSFDSPYPYDTFKADHKLIVYNDVNKRFPFESLFHKITEDFTYDKRYVDAIVIPHEDSPRHLVITNYSLTGDGSSYRRRQHIVEFSDYFNDEHTPKDEFNQRFFIDWDDTEWNRFYNFMVHCVQLYKKNGLVAFPAQNARLNKLLMESSEDFIDWMDELFVGSKEAAPVRSLTRNDRTELFENLKKDVRIHSEMKNSNKFTGWVKNWAELRGFYMQVDKSGRNYYWTFVKKEK